MISICGICIAIGVGLPVVLDSDWLIRVCGCLVAPPFPYVVRILSWPACPLVWLVTFTWWAHHVLTLHIWQWPLSGVWSFCHACEACYVNWQKNNFVCQHLHSLCNLCVGSTSLKINWGGVPWYWHIQNHFMAASKCELDKLKFLLIEIWNPCKNPMSLPMLIYVFGFAIYYLHTPFV